LKKSRFLGVLAIVLILSLALVGCGNEAAAPEQPAGEPAKVFKVGLVTDVGGLNDKSFNYLANQGLEKAKADFGITTAVVESKQMTDYETNLARFATEGYDLVVAVGFLMQDATAKVAADYPDTNFLIIDSVVEAPNVASAIFKTEQAGYLVGVMAGLMELDSSIPNMNEDNTVGMVGGMKIPPVDDYIAGFYQGARSVNPDINIKLNYTNKFDDPVLGKQTALAQIADGADIVFHIAGGTGTGVINAAKEKGVYAIGVDADQNYMAPETVITSAMKGVDVATYSITKDVVEGKFTGGVHYFELANDGVGYAPANAAVPQDIIDKVNAAAQDIKDGKITVTNVVPAE